MLLDLGSGPRPRYGHEGVDKVAHGGVAHVVDLEVFPWPWADDSVQGANSNQLVEHIVDLVGFMNELWRVCKDGAEVTIQHPYQFSVRAFQDPTHVRALNEISFFYFDKTCGYSAAGDFGPADFEIVELDAIPEENWKLVAAESPEEFERASRNQINVIADLKWVLRARKA